MRFAIRMKSCDTERHIKADRAADPSRRGFAFWSILFGVIVVSTVTLFSFSFWYEHVYNMAFIDLLFTLKAPKAGTSQVVVYEACKSCLPWIIGSLILYVGGVFLVWQKRKFSRVIRRISAIVCLLAFLATSCYALLAFQIPDYRKMQKNDTHFYDEYYVDPKGVSIKVSEPKNLIYIYAESMETAYASQDVGGFQKTYNHIPKLTEYALDDANVSFSDGDLLGGFHSVSGTGWTMGALMGSTSGVPFSLAVYGEENNNEANEEVGKNGRFANGLTTLGDILAHYHYNQEFICGSNATFAGRSTYFTVHGNYKIYDLFTAQKNGDLPINEENPDEPYFDDWWGFEDCYLFEIAKKEVLALAEKDEPFNLTLLTVDTHSVGGHRCVLCEEGTYVGTRDDSKETVKLANVVACTDRQIAEFIEWCKTQDFYEDTVIVVTGDHPRMDVYLVGDVDVYERPVYNCILNSAVSPTKTKNRVFTTMDLFPTVLAAMGFTIAGDRLGLGTNLFSDLPTLAEEHSFEWLNEQVSSYSKYYAQNFY